MRQRQRAVPAILAAALALVLMAGPVAACGGLIGPNGAVNLLRTTTFAGYHDGVEHYVTAFQFAGGGGPFGSITPLPGVPSSVEQGRRLDPPAAHPGDPPGARGVRPPSSPRRPAAGAEELMKIQIDALDITVLKGGGGDVGAWAKAHGFRLPPDAPEVLDFYAERSPIFLAAALRRRCRRGPRPADRRRHAGPHHDPDRQPVGPAADPRPRQDRRRARRGRRLPPDRPRAGAAAGADRRERHAAGPQRRRDDLAARRPPLATAGMEWVPARGVADQGRRRRHAPASSLRPRDRRQRRRNAVADRRRARLPGIGPVARTTADASRGSTPTASRSRSPCRWSGSAAIVFLARYQPGRRAG